MPFPDPSKPIATCGAGSCTGCPVSGAIHCHFRPKDLVHFLLTSLPWFITGGAGLLGYAFWSLAAWIGIVIGYFGFLEIRVLCSHCPHYAEEGRVLGCWANNGVPKLWKYRPGPMSAAEKTLFLGGMTLVWVFPLPFILIAGEWFMLVLYVMTSAAFFSALKLFLCTQCMNFACPFNSVREEVRERFFQQNPTVAEAWGRHLV